MKVEARKADGGGRQSLGGFAHNPGEITQKNCKWVDFMGKDLEPRIWQSNPDIDQVCDPG